MGSDAVWWQITVVVWDTKRGSAIRQITRKIGLERPQEQEKTIFKGRCNYNKQILVKGDVENQGKVAPLGGILGFELINWVLANELSSFLPHREFGLGLLRFWRQERESWVPLLCKR